MVMIHPNSLWTETIWLLTPPVKAGQRWWMTPGLSSQFFGAHLIFLRAYFGLTIWAVNDIHTSPVDRRQLTGWWCWSSTHVETNSLCTKLSLAVEWFKMGHLQFANKNKNSTKAMFWTLFRMVLCCTLRLKTWGMRRNKQGASIFFWRDF